MAGEIGVAGWAIDGAEGCGTGRVEGCDAMPGETCRGIGLIGGVGTEGVG